MGFLDNSFSGILPANGMATPALLAQRRKLAEAMLMQGTDTSPIASPWQGAARLMQAYVGGTMMNKANQQEIQGRQDAAAKLGAAMSSDKPDYAATLSSPWIDPSTVVSMANSNRDYGLRKSEFDQNKINADRTYNLTASEAGWKPLADGTFVNILTGQKIDPYGALGGGANALPPGGNPPPSPINTGAPGQVTAQPIPGASMPGAPPQPPAAAPQMPAGANAPDGAGLPPQPVATAPQATASPAGPLPPMPTSEPNYSGMSQVEILRKRGIPITADNLTAATALREGGPGMSGADIAGGKDLRNEVISGQPYVNMQEGTAALNGMAANLDANTVPANTAFMHAFVQALTPSKVIKNAQGQTQLVSADPETMSAAIQKAKSYFTNEGILTPEAKHAMMEAAKAQAGVYQKSYTDYMNGYRDVAKRNGMHLDKIVPELGGLPADQPPAASGVPNSPKVFNWTPEKGLH